MLKSLFESEGRLKGKLNATMAHQVLDNGSRLLLSDLYGGHLVASLFSELAKRVLTEKAATAGENDRVVSACFKILSQVSCLPSNFAALGAKEGDLMRDEKLRPELSQLNRYLELQRGLATFADYAIKECKFSGSARCALLWVTALDVLQNLDYKSYPKYVIHVIQQTFCERFEADVFDSQQIVSIMVTMDILELFVMVLSAKLEDETRHQLNIIVCQLIVIAEDKVPAEGSAVYKKLASGKNFGYEGVVCGLIQLCLLISNRLASAENVLLISHLLGHTRQLPQEHHTEGPEGRRAGEDLETVPLRADRVGREVRPGIPLRELSATASFHVHAERGFRLLQQAIQGPAAGDLQSRAADCAYDVCKRTADRECHRTHRQERTL